MVQDIFRIDWSRVRFKRAAGAVVVLFAVLAFIGSASDLVLTVVLSTMFVTAVGGGGSLADRLPRMVSFAIFGGLLGGLAFWSFDSVLAVALVLGLATYLGTLAAAAGPDAAQGGLFLTLWAIFAILFGSSETPAWEVTLAFLFGSSVGIGIVALRIRLGLADDAGSDPRDGSSPMRLANLFEIVWAAIPGPIGRYAIVRSAAIVVAVLLGDWWFASYPLWVAITVLVSLHPSAEQSVSIAVQRTLGTAIGVVAAVLIASLLPRSDVGVVIAFALSGLLMIAFQGANYTLFAAFLTAMLIFGQRLAQADAFEAGWTRLAATAVGGAIALGVAVLFGKRSSASEQEQRT